LQKIIAAAPITVAIAPTALQKTSDFKKDQKVVEQI
jgi:hypothetical protein